MTNQPLASISNVTLRAASIALTLACAFLFGAVTTQPAQARTFTVQYNFTGADGAGPQAGLVRDKAGNLYGTTFGGGAHSWGTVFELTPKAGGGWSEKVLHSFNLNGKDGFNPTASLVLDAAGNLYGTTLEGGNFSSECEYGCGTVFELTPKAGGGWSEKVLHSFNSRDGLAPWGAGVILDAAGNLYGTTIYGGSGTCFNEPDVGCGTVFELTPKAGGGWSEKVLYSFKNNSKDGNYPQASLIFDAAGNLYGTTVGGGATNYGTVFELMPTESGTWTEKVLYGFNSSHGGGGPYSSLIFDSSGNLYGTITGSGNCNSGNGCGSVFELVRKAGGAWTGKVLHKFNGADGDNPHADLILNASGSLYGTTQEGGSGTCNGGCGTVFQLTHKAGGAWTEKVLHNFNGSEGYAPNGLILGASGNLYGTTFLGGAHRNGTVFKLTP
jgi:uncharacterized repeat protein (TIGR03803 family)